MDAHKGRGQQTQTGEFILINVNDVLIDPIGELYLVFGIPSTMNGVFLARDTAAYTEICTGYNFSGLIWRHKKYVAESFQKIGTL